MNPGRFLYRTANKFFETAIKTAVFFSPKAQLFVDGRKNIFKSLEKQLTPTKNEKRVWFHCASLGEFEQGRPLIERIKREYPEYKIFITFYSPSGYEVRKKYSEADYVYYLPLDSPRNAKRFIDLVDPMLVFFVKYEFWYYYLYELNQRNIPVYSVSAIFRPGQLFFKTYGGFYRKMLHFFSHIFVQNKQSKHLLESIGIQHVTISGDTRFDRVVKLGNDKQPIPVVEQFKGGQKVFVIGSSWKEDMEVLIPFINRNEFNLKFIIAPHEISEQQLKALEEAIKLTAVRFSKAESDSVNQFDVLIIDNIGMLSSLYAYGSYAYVGGGFGKGLHNILEAATYGIPVVFGNKNYRKFQEANELIAEGGAFAIENPNDLNRVFQQLSKESYYNKVSGINKAYVENNAGATGVILSHCQQALKKE